MFVTLVLVVNSYKIKDRTRRVKAHEGGFCGMRLLVVARLAVCGDLVFHVLEQGTESGTIEAHRA